MNRKATPTIIYCRTDERKQVKHIGREQVHKA